MVFSWSEDFSKSPYDYSTNQINREREAMVVHYQYSSYWYIGGLYYCDSIKSANAYSFTTRVLVVDKEHVLLYFYCFRKILTEELWRTGRMRFGNRPSEVMNLHINITSWYKVCALANIDQVHFVIYICAAW